jgi:WhiB family redox-sensing transcriptional regulator
MALCRQVDPEIFYPPWGDNGASYDAQQVCKQCPVIDECLEYALALNEQFGTWGGMTPRQRTVERRRRRMEAAPPPKPKRTACSKGHDLTRVGVDRRGQCCECRRNYDRQRRIDGRKGGK